MWGQEQVERGGRPLQFVAPCYLPPTKEGQCPSCQLIPFALLNARPVWPVFVSQLRSEKAAHLSHLERGQNRKVAVASNKEKLVSVTDGKETEKIYPTQSESHKGWF